MFVLLVNVEVRSDAIDEFADAIARNARLSAERDHGCLRFEVGQVEGEPTKWVFFEVYTDEAAWQAHRRSPHFLEYQAVAERALVSRTLTPLVPKVMAVAS
jgi:(4S)-4-hydroxy-5-phosphonooxypentane-2,3-dione isomerase